MTRGCLGLCCVVLLLCVLLAQARPQITLPRQCCRVHPAHPGAAGPADMPCAQGNPASLPPLQRWVLQCQPGAFSLGEKGEPWWWAGRLGCRDAGQEKRLASSKVPSTGPNPAGAVPHRPGTRLMDLLCSSHHSFCNERVLKPVLQNYRLFFPVFSHGLLTSKETNQQFAVSSK